MTEYTKNTCVICNNNTGECEVCNKQCTEVSTEVCRIISKAFILGIERAVENTKVF